MSNLHPPAIRTEELLGIANKVFEVVGDSLSSLKDWQTVELLSRFTFGTGDLRNITIQIRQQPADIMSVIHESLDAATHGKSLCTLGLAATKILLGEGCRVPDQEERKKFVEDSLSDIQADAANIVECTKGTQRRFRDLRVRLLEIHRDLNVVISKRERLDLLARLSRYFNKDIKSCEEALRKICDGMQQIEESLNLIVRWWQAVQARADYLKMNSGSSVVHEGNRIMLNEIRGSFVSLDQYFEKYTERITQLYDENRMRLGKTKQNLLSESRTQ